MREDPYCTPEKNSSELISLMFGNNGIIIFFLLVDMRSNIPAAPSTLSQAAWSASSPLSVAPQTGSMATNEKQGFIKKDSIPAAPVQAGSSSYPLQLNKHSPGAELIKKFFIAKQQGIIYFCLVENTNLFLKLLLFVACLSHICCMFVQINKPRGVVLKEHMEP